MILEKIIFIWLVAMIAYTLYKFINDIILKRPLKPKKSNWKRRKDHKNLFW